MGTSKRYNSVPVKDNCALFAPIPLFLGLGYPTVSLKFSLADPCSHGNEFWDKIDYKSAPVKDNCFHLSPPVFGPALADGVIWISSLTTPVAIATNFGIKMTTTRPPWKIIAPCLHLPPLYAAARLYSVAMGQIPCSTERISSMRY